MCVSICQCNSCYKRNTCSDCVYNFDIKKCDCMTTGIQNCPHYREDYRPYDDEKRVQTEKGA